MGNTIGQISGPVTGFTAGGASWQQQLMHGASFNAGMSAHLGLPFAANPQMSALGKSFADYQASLPRFYQQNPAAAAQMFNFATSNPQMPAAAAGIGGLQVSGVSQELMKQIGEFAKNAVANKEGAAGSSVGIEKASGDLATSAGGSTGLQVAKTAIKAQMKKGILKKVFNKVPFLGAAISAINVAQVYLRKKPPATKAEKAAAWVGLAAGVAAIVPGVGTAVSTGLNIASTVIGTGGLVVGAVKKAQYNKAQEAQEQAIATNNYKATVGDAGAIAGGVDQRLDANGNLIQGPTEDVQQQFAANFNSFRFGGGGNA